MGINRQKLLCDEPLSPKTTLQVGGAARYFYTAESAGDLIAALEWAKAEELPLFILGGGSNVVFPDQGWPGLVLSPGFAELEETKEGAFVALRVGAGMEWDRLVATAVASGWAGIECLSGIPGMVGAAPIQNIGAYGQELAEVCTRVEVIDRDTGEMNSLTAAECGFAYRTSIFKHGPLADRFVVTAVHLRLRIDGVPTIRYPELKRQLPQDADLQQTRDGVLAIRRSKSMVRDASDPNARSCGSFFTNPILDETGYQAFLTRNPGDHPSYPEGDGRIKLSAAWLIEHAGFSKGYRMGSAGLSEKHCLALINRGGASTGDVYRLKEHLQAGVKQRFGIDLMPEPVLVNQPEVTSRDPNRHD